MIINLRGKTKRVSFTIIEVLVVISILATSGVNPYSRVTKYFDKPKDLEISRDLKQYQDAITCLIPTGKPFTEENINKYLDPSLQFTGGLSREENPYGNKYKLEGDGLNTATVVSEGKGGNPDAQEVVNINKNNGGATVNNATKYDKTEAIKNLARSLGFVILNKTVEESQPHYEELYNNFTTNTKSVVDRIAGKKRAGDSTYDVTPAELESFGNELTSAIESSVEAGEPVTLQIAPFNPPFSSNSGISYSDSKSYEFPEFPIDKLMIDYNIPFNRFLNYRVYYDDELLYDYGIKRYNLSSTLLNWWLIKDNITGNTVKSNNMGVQYDKPWMTYWKIVGSRDKVEFAFPPHLLVYYPDTGFDYTKLRIVYGYDFEKEPPVINVCQMNVSGLIAALQSPEALNSQDAVTQQFITNYSKLPSTIYSNDTIKRIVTNLEK